MTCFSMITDSHIEKKRRYIAKASVCVDASCPNQQFFSHA